MGVFAIDVREGLIPIVLRTAVTATGFSLRNCWNVNSVVPWSIAAFGLAHVVLGTIDLIEHKR